MDTKIFRTLLLFVALVLVLWGFGVLLWPFLMAISWALCAVAVTRRPYDALVRRWRKPRLVAVLLTFGTALALAVPIVFVGTLLVGEVRRIAEGGFDEVVGNLREDAPRFYARVDELLGRLGTSLATVATDAAQLAKQTVPRWAGGVLGGVFSLGFGMLVMLATQYFVYRDADRLRRFVRDLIPLGDDQTDEILGTLGRMTVAAIFGGIVVALVQGTIGGVGFAIVGIRSPVLWGAVMAVASLIPLGGTALVWGPAALYLFLTGETGGGWFLVVWGALVLGLSDNVLRPWILRRAGGTEIHPLMLLFAILSGISLFGMSGIVFGPLMIGVLTTVTKLYREQLAPAMRASR